MVIVFNRLWDTMQQKGVSTYFLREKCGIDSKTIRRLRVNENIETVPVSEGFGNGSISIHPDLAVQRIRETVEKAVRKDKKDCMFPLPEHFRVEIDFVKHHAATNASWYPGCVQLDAKRVAFEADDYLDVLKFLHWVL